MADRPIIFSGPMVKALLQGRKTQTRRLASSPLAKCQPGDRLWVRENFWYREEGDCKSVCWAADFDWEGGPDFQRERGYRLRPCIHMPRWGSRLTLLVEAVRHQRLHDMAAADAEAEGVVYETADPPFWYVPGILPHSVTAAELIDGPVTSFAKLWAHLHGADSWLANPKVVALTFRVGQHNVDWADARVV